MKLGLLLPAQYAILLLAPIQNIILHSGLTFPESKKRGKKPFIRCRMQLPEIRLTVNA